MYYIKCPLGTGDMYTSIRPKCLTTNNYIFEIMNIILPHMQSTSGGEVIGVGFHICIFILYFILLQQYFPIFILYFILLQQYFPMRVT